MFVISRKVGTDSETVVGTGVMNICMTKATDEEVDSRRVWRSFFYRVGGSGGVEIVQDFVDPLVSRRGSELGFGDG